MIGCNDFLNSFHDTSTLQVAADLAAKQFMAELQPWIKREKAEHIKRIVAIAKRGFRRIEKLWDETEVADSKAESLAAATLDKHDAMIRRNLGMNETPAGSCSLNLHVLTGGRTIISPQQSIDGLVGSRLRRLFLKNQLTETKLLNPFRLKSRSYSMPFAHAKPPAVPPLCPVSRK